MSTLDRFMAKFEVGADGCWVWRAAATQDGYGSFWCGERRADKSPIMVLAHRWSYEQFAGPVPDGFNVCHHCDNPPCVNPDHLFTGTQADNVHDCIAKGRRGKPVTYHKLSLEQHEAIRRRYTGKRGEQTALGREFGVSQATIWSIVGGRARTRCAA